MVFYSEQIPIRGVFFIILAGAAVGFGVGLISQVMSNLFTNK